MINNYIIKTKMQIAYHISDIHIKYNMKDDTRKDLHYAIDNLLTIINTEPEPVFLVITGDVYDIANRINPEELLTFHEIIKKLSDSDKIKHILIIPGNHDYLVNPEYNIIYASLVSSEYNKKILHFNKNTNIVIDGVNFTAVANPKISYILDIQDVPKMSTNVLLLHETIKGAALTEGYIYSGDGPDPKTFDNYHAVMLGDIHKHQHIHRPTIAYAGSLIQRNFGEDLNHGAIRWELNGVETTNKFIPLKLRRAYITRYADNNKIVGAIDPNMYESVKKVRFIYQNCAKQFVDKCIKGIYDKYNRLDLIINHTDALATTPVITASHEAQPMLNTNKIIDDWLLEKYPNNLTNYDIQNNLKSKNEILREQILAVHNRMSEKVKLGIGKYKLISLAWKNVFCYGEDNFIDFTKLSGITSIIGKNGVGKSSIINILFYVLYDETFGAKDILNTCVASKEFQITCIFEIQGDQYKIVKSNKNRGATALNIYKNNKLLEYKSIPDKNAALREIIGMPSNVLRNNIAQQVHVMYLDKSQNAFYEEIMNYLNLTEYLLMPDKIKEYTNPIKRKIKELDDLIKKFTTNDQSEDLSAKLSTESARLDSLESEKEQISTERDAVNRKYISESADDHECTDSCSADPAEIKQLIETVKAEIAVSSSTTNSDWLVTDLSQDDILSNIKTIESENQQFIANFREIDNKLNNLRDLGMNYTQIAYNPKFPDEKTIVANSEKLDKMAVFGIEKYKSELDELCKKRKGMEDYIVELTGRLNNTAITPTYPDAQAVQTRIDELLKEDVYKWNNNCECCMHNMVKLRKNVDPEELTQLNKQLEYFADINTNSLIDNVDNNLKPLIKQIAELTSDILLFNANIYYKNAGIKRSINFYKTEQTNIKTQLEANKTKLADYKKMLVYVQNADIIVNKAKLAKLVGCYNNIINAEFAIINKKFANINTAIKQQMLKIKNLEKQIELAKQNEDLRAQRWELQNELSVYEEYLEFVNPKKGIPSVIIKKYIPLLNQNVNNILEKIVDYKIMIDEDGKITDMATGVLSLQSSGSQKFCTDLILRLCLVNNHPYLPNFMIIDEGFGSLDSETLIDMCQFIEKINAYVNIDFLIVISHIEELNQIAKTKLVIEREKVGETTVSKLVYK